MKRSTAKPLADLLEGCLKPALAAQGFAAADIVVAWGEIVGPRLAEYCEPLKLNWPRKSVAAARDHADPATLVVRVEGAFAIELQHMAPVVIERVNAYYGWRCVGRLSLQQGPVGRDRIARRKIEPPDPEALAAARARIGEMSDEPLREALVRLGGAILTRRSVS
jgi:hypothetical protein